MSSIGLAALERTASLYSKNLDANDLKSWAILLRGCTDQALSWAFEDWCRNSEFFPKPAQILELVHVFGNSGQNKKPLCGNCADGWIVCNPEAKPSDWVMRRCECVEQAIAEAKVATHVCDDACKRRHGRGYHTNDILWLWKARQKSAKPWDEHTYNLALDTLDAARSGGAPVWRKP